MNRETSLQGEATTTGLHPTPRHPLVPPELVGEKRRLLRLQIAIQPARQHIFHRKTTRKGNHCPARRKSFEIKLIWSPCNPNAVGWHRVAARLVQAEAALRLQLRE